LETNDQLNGNLGVIKKIQGEEVNVWLATKIIWVKLTECKLLYRPHNDPRLFAGDIVLYYGGSAHLFGSLGTVAATRDDSGRLFVNFKEKKISCHPSVLVKIIPPEEELSAGCVVKLQGNTVGLVSKIAGEEVELILQGDYRKTVPVSSCTVLHHLLAKTKETPLESYVGRTVCYTSPFSIHFGRIGVVESVEDGKFLIAFNGKVMSYSPEWFTLTDTKKGEEVLGNPLNTENLTVGCTVYMPSKCCRAVVTELMEEHVEVLTEEGTLEILYSECRITWRPHIDPIIRVGNSVVCIDPKGFDHIFGTKGIVLECPSRFADYFTVDFAGYTASYRSKWLIKVSGKDTTTDAVTSEDPGPPEYEITDNTPKGKIKNTPIKGKKKRNIKNSSPAANDLAWNCVVYIPELATSGIIQEIFLDEVRVKLKEEDIYECSPSECILLHSPHHDQSNIGLGDTVCCSDTDSVHFCSLGVVVKLRHITDELFEVNFPKGLAKFPASQLILVNTDVAGDAVGTVNKKLKEEIKMSEGNVVVTGGRGGMGGMFDSMKDIFGPMGSIPGDQFRLALTGVAVKNSAGQYAVYDADRQRMSDVSIMTFGKGYSDFFFALPTPTEGIVPGDIILPLGEPLFVESVNEDTGRITCLNPTNNKEEIHVPMGNMFGLELTTKVWSAFGMFGSPSVTGGGVAGQFMGSNPMMLIALMNMMKKGGIGAGGDMASMMLLPMILGMGGGSAQDGESPTNPMAAMMMPLMMSSMFGSGGGLGDVAGQDNPMAAMMMPLLMSGMFGSGGGMNNVMSPPSLKKKAPRKGKDNNKVVEE